MSLNRLFVINALFKMLNFWIRAVCWAHLARELLIQADEKIFHAYPLAGLLSKDLPTSIPCSSQCPVQTYFYIFSIQRNGTSLAFVLFPKLDLSFTKFMYFDDMITSASNALHIFCLTQNVKFCKPIAYYEPRRLIVIILWSGLFAPDLSELWGPATKKGSSPWPVDHWALL